MGIEDRLNRVVQHREAHIANSHDNYRQQSRVRLQKSVETKINTTMIGAIAAVEQKFGHLWGQGKSADQLTERELEWLAVKDALRTEILNNGNNQKRAAVAEIKQYEVEWKRHHLNMEVVDIADVRHREQQGRDA